MARTTRTTSHPASAVVYRGASLIDGAPIVVIATGLRRPSVNSKTGPMVQTFIVRADIAPGVAIRNGADRSVCGGCPHLQSAGGDCYVDVDKSVRSAWDAVNRGTTPDMDPATVGQIARSIGRRIRLGAYGDPGAVPWGVWAALLTGQPQRTGYTHQWTRRPDLRPVAMASVDSRTEAITAQSAGWRTFRVLSPGEQLLPGEISCPASKESGHRTTCAKCGLCSGSTGPDDRRASIAILAH